MGLESLGVFVLITEIGKDKRNFFCQIKEENKLAVLKLVLEESSPSQPRQAKSGKISGNQQLSLFQET